mmetsp:Transcript_28370/g.73553  ORF Transcript_28370/g.73553 Transcript_28370/m.73553 type:complete len:243 (-) Transcript_28370:596-1324(-)
MAWTMCTGSLIPFRLCRPWELKSSVSVVARRCSEKLSTRDFHVVSCSSTCPPCAAEATLAAWFMKGPKYSMRPVREEICMRSGLPQHMPTFTRGPPNTGMPAIVYRGSIIGQSSSSLLQATFSSSNCSLTENVSASSERWKAHTKLPSSPSISYPWCWMRRARTNELCCCSACPTTRNASAPFVRKYVLSFFHSEMKVNTMVTVPCGASCHAGVSCVSLGSAGKNMVRLRSGQGATTSSSWA